MTAKESQEKYYGKIGMEYFNVSSFAGDTRDQLLKPANSKPTEGFPLEKLPNIRKKENNYLESIVNEFKFSYEVAAEQCAYLLPYNEKFYESVYSFPGTVKKIKKRKCYFEKHFCRSEPNKIDYPPLPPVGKPDKTANKPNKSLAKGLDNKTIHGDPIEAVATENEMQPSRKHWDEYILSLMSQNTAQYLAYDLTKDVNQADRLQRLVDSWYGPPSSFRELIPDGSIDADQDDPKSDLKSVFPYKYFMDKIRSVDQPPVESTGQFQAQPTVKARISNLVNTQDNKQLTNDQTDPYGDDTKASFYRLPVLVRRTKKINKEMNIESVNPTTRSTKEFQLPKTPQTSLNPKIGDKVLKTDNQFQQDLFFGEEKSQKKLLNEPDNIINLDDKIYVKNLQPIWPCQIMSNRCPNDDVNASQLLETGTTKGQNRWTQLPSKQEKDLMRADNALETENIERQNSRKRARDHSSLNLLVDQWRKKWQLTQKYADSTVDELLRDMSDVHPTIRLQAIVTAAKAATIIHNQKYEGQISTVQETINSDCLPPILISAIEILLDDPHFQVRKAATIALHSLEKSTDKSLNILKELLVSESNVDRWAAVQCLALTNGPDSFVIGELIDQLMNSEDILVHEKASYLLAKVSYHSKLVHGMLGEKLNAISWRQRLIICKTISLLHGSLNKDLLRKIIYLMWHDPHKQVKIAASQVLGKTGNGKAVHDELIAKLQSDSELIRADALEKIGILKVMTTRIMPAFLKCFHDEFVLVRKEICRACYCLEIQDTICVNNLLHLARYDPLWKVKFYAIRALSKVTTSNSEIRSCFLWALQFESNVHLRLVALQAISIMLILDNEIVDIIKCRFLVESDTNILRILRKILNKVNINPETDINTVAEIKGAVRKFFSDKNHIIDLILTNEATEDYNFLKETLIDPTKPLGEFSEKPEELEPVSEMSGSESEDYSTNDVLERFNSDLMVSHLTLRSTINQSDEPIVGEEEKYLIDSPIEISNIKDQKEFEEELLKAHFGDTFIDTKSLSTETNDEINDSEESPNDEKPKEIKDESKKIDKEESPIEKPSNEINHETEKNEIENGKYPEKPEIQEISSEIEKEEKENVEINYETEENENDENKFEIESGKNLEKPEIQKISSEREKVEKEESQENKENVEINYETEESQNNRNKIEIENEKNPENMDNPETKEIIGENGEVENFIPRIKWSFIMPTDTNHIRIVNHEKSMMNRDSTLFEGEVKIDLLESMISPDIRRLVDEAVKEEGLDFESL